MAQAYKVAGRILSEYSRSKGYEWPGFEASQVLCRTWIDAEGGWRPQASVSHADSILSRALFDVDDLAENHLGIRLHVESLHHLDKAAGTPVYGVAYPGSREILICERALEYEPLYRTTVMHEVGHVVLHEEVSPRCLWFTPSQAGISLEEREANQFMHVALLPRPILKLAIAYICSCWRLQLRLALVSANSQRGRWIWRHRLLASIINMLCVSRQMVCYKMRQMKCFTPETVRFHFGYPLETKWGPAPAPVQPLAATIEEILDSTPVCEHEFLPAGF